MRLYSRRDHNFPRKTHAFTHVVIGTAQDCASFRARIASGVSRGKVWARPDRRQARGPARNRPGHRPAHAFHADAERARRDRSWRDVEFRFAGRIQPKRAADGTVLLHAPQDRYAKRDAVRLNNYGTGPFCEFRLRGLPHSSGVYVYVLRGEQVYVGQAVDLDARFYAYAASRPRTATAAAARRTAA